MIKKLSRKKKIAGGVALLLILTIGVMTTFASPADNGGNGNGEAIVSRGDIGNYYSYEGNIEATQSQVIYSSTMDTIKKFYVEEGDMVTVGQKLYTLDNNNLANAVTASQATLSSAQIAVNDAQINAERMTSLYENGAVSKQEYEAAASSLSSARNQLTQAQANHQTSAQQQRDLDESANVAGEVIGIFVDEHESMALGTKVMEIVNYGELKVEIKVDEYDVGAIAEGGKAEVLVNALGEDVMGTITKISKKAEVVNGVSYFPTEITFDDLTNLRVGMSVEVKVVAEQKEDVLLVPKSAVQFDEGNRAYVTMKKENKGKKETVNVPIEMGISNEKFIEVKEGVNEGDMVLLFEQAASDAGQMMMMRQH